jgi:hypothetical protein
MLFVLLTVLETPLVSDTLRSERTIKNIAATDFLLIFKPLYPKLKSTIPITMRHSEKPFGTIFYRKIQKIKAEATVFTR